MTDQADIVERLRSIEVFISDGGISPVAYEAATEITRLREALAREREECAAIAEDKFGDVEIAAAIRARTP